MQRFGRASWMLTVFFVGVLPFLVPFDAYRNIDLQGIMLLIAGGSGIMWLVISRTRPHWKRLPATAIALYTACCLLSLLTTPYNGYALLGSPYVRLGALGLVSCIVIGIVVLQIGAEQLTSYLYIALVAVALVSVPYTLLQFTSLERAGGIVAQADVLGVLTGCALLLGLELLRQRWHQRILLVVQLLLIGVLLLTSTRAALGLTVVLAGLWQWQQHRAIFIKRLPLYLLGMVLLVLLAGSHLGRLSDRHYAAQSVSYRAALQQSGLHASAERPLFGYGAGNLADALPCDTFTDPALQQTCDDGYFFNSSHNIYLDRVLALGWLGGLAFLSVVMLALIAGLRAATPQQKIYGYVVLFIALYYLTNVTSVVLELLLWVALFQCLRTSRV